MSLRKKSKRPPVKKISLYVGLVTLLFFSLGLVIYMKTPKPGFPSLPLMQEIEKDLQQETPAYKYRNTTLHLVKGDILKFYSVQEYDGYALGAKLRLNTPIVKSSIDYKLMAVICPDSADSACRNRYIRDKEQIARNRHPGSDKEGIWLATYSNDRLQKPIFFLAGIEIDPLEQINNDEKERRLEEGIYQLCNTAKKNKLKRICIPLIGTGAAQLQRQAAMGCIIAGINRSAAVNNGRLDITLCLFPGKPFYDKGFRQGPLYDSLNQDWIKLHQAAIHLLSENRLRKHRAWEPVGRKLFWGQAFLMLGFIAAGTFVTLKWNANVLGFKEIPMIKIINLLLATVLPYIGLELGHELVKNPTGFLANLSDLPLGAFTLLACFFFLYSTWQWHCGLQEIKNQQNHS